MGPIVGEWELIGSSAVARRKINQSPASESPDVPMGSKGLIEDYDGENFYVDFGGEYGVVICALDELT